MIGFSRLVLFIFLAPLLLQEEALANLLTAGQFHSCVWDGGSESSIVCWGLEEEGLTQPDASIKNIKQLASGDWHSCAIYEIDRENRIYCWGKNDYGQLDIPSDPNPVFLALGKTHSCGLFQGDTGLYVKCWGGTSSESAVKDYPLMNEVKGLFSGKGFSCAHHGDSLDCWGNVEGTWRIDEQPTMRGVLSGFNLQCQISRQARVPTCWTNTERKMDFANSFQACSLSLGQMPVCVKNGSPVQIVLNFERPLVNPRSIAVGLWHICILDDLGVECAGSDNSEEQLSIPQELLVFGPHFSGFDTSRTFLHVLSDFVYEFDSQFIDDVLRASDGDNSRFLIALLQGYIEDLRYPYLKEYFLKISSQNINKAMREEGMDGISTFSDNTDGELRRIAFSVLLHSLRTARGLYANPIQAEIEDLERGLVQATARSELNDALAERIGYFSQCHTSLNPYLSARSTVESGALEFLKRGTGVKQHVCRK